jgi:hypothetical protein
MRGNSTPSLNTGDTAPRNFAASFRVGGVIIRYPRSVRYLDSI